MIAKRAMLGLAVAGAAAGVGAYEEPAYEVVAERDGFEVRQYAPYVVAQTTARGEFDGARTEAFSRLFAYITGRNETRREMAMTVPVTSTVSTQLAPRAAVAPGVMPVSTADAPGDESTQTMRFALPSQYSLDSAPEPTDPRVTLRQVKRTLMAVLRYSGRSNLANYEAHRTELLAQLTDSGYEPAGPAMMAVYNGPHTPWFLRRNEVMVPVRATPAQSS